jgi:hypothetical protein
LRQAWQRFEGVASRARRLAVVLLAALALLPATGAAQSAATATAVSGTVAVQNPEGTTRLLAPRSEVRPGDVVSTQSDSYAKLRFSDGGELALRPNTQVRIEAYRFNPDAPREDSIILGLLKGGLRSITGLISRRGDRDAYQLRTPTATIGIRGTDYVARVCTDDCAQELAARDASGRRAVAPALIARVLQVQGEAVAVTPGGERRLAVGDPVYRRDRLETAGGGMLVLAFLDESRIVLLPGSKFSVEEYRYEPQRPGAGAMLLNLTQGGLRALTGLIARARPQAVRVTTPTATVGVRGTGLDVYTDVEAMLQILQAMQQMQPSGGAADEALRQAQIALANAILEGTSQLGGGATTAAITWRGRTFMSAGGDRRSMNEFDGFYVGRDGRLHELPPEVLDRMRNFGAPRPDQFAFDPKLFGESPAFDPDSLFVLVRSGSIVLSQGGEQLVLATGESAQGGPGRTLARLGYVPPFIEADPFLGPPVFDPQFCRP